MTTVTIFLKVGYDVSVVTKSLCVLPRLRSSTDDEKTFSIDHLFSFWKVKKLVSDDHLTGVTNQHLWMDPSKAKRRTLNYIWKTSKTFAEAFFIEKFEFFNVLDLRSIIKVFFYFKFKIQLNDIIKFQKNRFVLLKTILSSSNSTFRDRRCRRSGQPSNSRDACHLNRGLATNLSRLMLLGIVRIQMGLVIKILFHFSENN